MLKDFKEFCLRVKFVFTRFVFLFGSSFYSISFLYSLFMCIVKICSSLYIIEFEVILRFTFVGILGLFRVFRFFLWLEFIG